MLMIPSYLIFSSVFLIIIPSFFAILLRLALYNHLKKSIRSVKMQINGNNSFSNSLSSKLKIRFNLASYNIEKVNTVALIDQAYAEEEFKLFSVNFNCDKADSFCRILPNLLLTFGLLGTFLGITISLTSLSEVVSQTNAISINDLTDSLQKPLQGMGIAFITSLIGLFFSVLLNIVNFINNTALLKQEFISSLEDYLDNIYYPSLQGQTRLDKIIKSMADSFDNFLGRFGITVREAIESSLKNKIQEISDANIKAAELAEQVYARLADTSGTLANGANEFKLATKEFTKAVELLSSSDFTQNLVTITDKFAETSQVLENNELIHSLSFSSQTMTSVQDNFSETVINLSNSIQDLNITTDKVNKISELIPTLLDKTQEISQFSSSLSASYEMNQNSLTEIVLKLSQAMKSSEMTVKKLEQLQKRMDSKVNGLDRVQYEISKLITSMQDCTKQLTKEIRTLVDARCTEATHDIEPTTPNTPKNSTPFIDL